jgi:hypothetical protein
MRSIVFAEKNILEGRSGSPGQEICRPNSGCPGYSGTYILQGRGRVIPNNDNEVAPKLTRSKSLQCSPLIGCRE